MQRNIRKLVIFAGLPLAAIALAVFVLGWGAGSGQKVQAAGAVVTGLNFNLNSPPGDATCNTDNPTNNAGHTCSVIGGTQFTVALDLSNTGGMPYIGYDAQIAWSGSVNYVNGSLKQQGTGIWDDGVNGCGFPAHSQSGGTPTPVASKSVIPSGVMGAGCAQGTSATAPSTFTGHLLEMTFDCKSGGSGTITLLQGKGTDTINSDLSTNLEAASGSEALTVTCKPTPTPVPPTATPTPPPVPRVQKLPVNQNVFLTHQSPKLAPQTCEGGNNAATLTESLSRSIVTSAKGATQHLGAFEFEVRYDDKLVCVSIAPGTLFSGSTAVCNSVAAKGLIRYGCVTVGKDALSGDPTPVPLNGPGVIAVISVRPQPELYSQLRPNQDNGIPVQILNQGCNASDDQGHEIPLFSCEDADITFRFLEGDVGPVDCAVDAGDAQNIAMRWGARKGSTLYQSFLDLSPSGQIKGDGRIDIQDLQFVFGRLGSTCTGTQWPAQPPINPKA